MSSGNPQGENDGDWRRAVDLIQDAPELWLACHVNPDADALGSMIGFALAMRASGRACHVSYGDEPLTVPRSLRFLPGLDLLCQPSEFPAAPDLMVAFDTASVERLGVLADSARKAGELIVIDHHPTNSRFGSIHLVDPGAAATAVLVEELLRQLALPLTRNVALCLYAGLASDTGSFKYVSTTPEVHLLASRLIATGLRPEAVAAELWDRASFGYLRVLAAALGRARWEPGAIGGLGLVWTTVPAADRVAHQVAYDEVEAVIDVVRRTDDAEVGVVFKEDDAGAWQVSVRSKGRVDVSRACVALGGGGHSVAAGFTTRAPVEQVMGRLRVLLEP